MLSEVDWGADDSSFFLFLVNIDYDAKSIKFVTQGLWGELQQSISSTPLIGHMTDSLDTGKTEDDASTPNQLILNWMTLNNLPGESIQPYLSLVGQLEWQVTLGETCHPWTSYYLAQVQVNSKEATKDLRLCQKDH